MQLNWVRTAASVCFIQFRVFKKRKKTYRKAAARHSDDTLTQCVVGCKVNFFLGQSGLLLQFVMWYYFCLAWALCNLGTLTCLA